MATNTIRPLGKTMLLARMRLIESLKKDLTGAGLDFNMLSPKDKKAFFKQLDTLIKEGLLKNKCEDLKTE